MDARQKGIPVRKLTVLRKSTSEELLPKYLAHTVLTEAKLIHRMLLAKVNNETEVRTSHLRG